MAKNILHMLSPLKHMSPFDVNMALDDWFPFDGYAVQGRHTSYQIDVIDFRDVCVRVRPETQFAHVFSSLERMPASPST